MDPTLNTSSFIISHTNGVTFCSSESSSVITLPDGLEIILGKSEVANTQGQNCSRQKIIIKANYNAIHNCAFEVNQFGVNPTRPDGVPMHRSIGQNPTYELLLTKYLDIVEVNPPTEENQRLVPKRNPEDEAQVKQEKIVKLEDPFTLGD